MSKEKGKIRNIKNREQMGKIYAEMGKKATRLPDEGIIGVSRKRLEE
jgi:hypothetical protein